MQNRVWVSIALLDRDCGKDSAVGAEGDYVPSSKSQLVGAIGFECPGTSCRNKIEKKDSRIGIGQSILVDANTEH